MTDETPPNSDPPPDGETPFRWWFEDEVDEELEAEYFGTKGELQQPVVAPHLLEDSSVDSAPARDPEAESEADRQPEPPAEPEARDDAGDPTSSETPQDTAPPVSADDDAAVFDVEEQRRQRRAQRPRARRRRSLRTLVGIVVVGLLAVALMFVPWDRLRRPEAPVPTPAETPTTAPVAEQDTLLLIRHGADDTGPALGITLLTAGGGNGSAVIFVPEGTIVDIPGFGQDRLGLAYQYGGAALVEASLENLLGIDIDHSAAVSNSGLAALLGRTGGLDIDVEQRLVNRTAAGAGRVRFEPGAQFLDGPRLLEFWEFRQRGESELDTFPRQQQVFASLLAAADDPQVVEALTSDGAPQLDTSADSDFLASLFTRLAAAQANGSLAYTLLPVTPFGAGDETGAITYKPDPEGVRRLAAGPLSGSVPADGTTQGVRIQVLNGVGTPGIGQEVDERLEGAGFRIVLTDNARSFDFNETRILVYAEDERSLAAAEEVQRRLGVGTIQISRQPQSVVDLTIVVGADFTAGQTTGETSNEAEEQSS